MRAEIESLAGVIEKDWSAISYDGSRFSEIATKRLTEFTDKIEYSPESLVGFVRAGLPNQVGDGTFGEPAVTLFSNSRFLIDLYVWLKPDISVHDHGFSGAFTVLEGASYHCKFDFDQIENPARGIYLGTLNLSSSEYLKKGAVRTIVAGSSFIHQVWHLSRPTVSLVVRTLKDNVPIPQRDFYRPGLAIFGTSPQPKDPIRHRKTKEMIRLAFEIGDPQSEARARDFILSLEPRMAIDALKDLLRWTGNQNTVEDVIEAYARKSGSWALDLGKAVFSGLGQIAIGQVHDEDLRYFVAQLLVHERLESIQDCMRKKHPESDPNQLILEYLNRLVAHPGLGLQLSKGVLDIVERLIYRDTPAEIFEKLVAAGAISRSSEGETKLNSLVASLRNLALLKPLIGPDSQRAS